MTSPKLKKKNPSKTLKNLSEEKPGFSLPKPSFALQKVFVLLSLDGPYWVYFFAPHERGWFFSHPGDFSHCWPLPLILFCAFKFYNWQMKRTWFRPQDGSNIYHTICPNLPFSLKLASSSSRNPNHTLAFNTPFSLGPECQCLQSYFPFLFLLNVTHP